jgi:hypothetical protein
MKVEQDRIASLRTKLAEIRSKLVLQLAAGIDGGDSALLGSVGAALQAIDAMRREEARASATTASEVSR